MDTLRMALQAVRGLYQAQLHRGGRPTFVHADLNPSQFLVFALDGKGGGNDEDECEGGGGLPLLQINDFNQGTERNLIRGNSYTDLHAVGGIAPTRLL